MNCYETLFVVKPTLTAEEIEGQIARVKEIIAEQGGEIKAVDDMGMRRLAYPIQKQERGYYSVIYFTAPPQLVIELERQLRYNEEILRFMTVKYSNKKELSVFEKMVEAAQKKSASTQDKNAQSSEQSDQDSVASSESAQSETPAQENESQNAEA